MAEDLAYLREINFGQARRTEVRVASSILRRLLFDGLLDACWRVLGFDGQPRFQAVDLMSAVSDVPRRYIDYAYAGGAVLPGAHYRGYVLVVIPREEQEAMGGPDVAAQRMRALLRHPELREFALDEFCASPCALSGPAAVSRVDMVRYVANKLGGVHLDAGRATWTDPLGSRYRFLDEGHVRVGRFPAPYYEVISIAVDVSHSPSAVALVEEADRQFPDDAAPNGVLAFREGRIGKFAEFNFSPPDHPVDEPGA